MSCARIGPSLIGVVAALMPLLASAQTEPLRGAGATFPYPIYREWMARYKSQTGVDIVYEPVGSGAGVARIARSAVDFGASDVPLPPAELQRLGLVQFPAIVGAVVPVVNIAGLKPGALRLTGQVLGDIFLGKVTRWDDASIRVLNPGVPLPGANITVVHRADSSGTTYLWSEYLSRSNAEWKARVGTGSTLSWPAGVAETGNEGVASAVRRTRVSIGYVEYAYAVEHGLRSVTLRNHDGVFVQPGHASMKAAADSVRWREPADLTQWLIDRPGPNSWPVTATSFVLLPAAAEARQRTADVARFFRWALRHGESMATELAYSPLPGAAVDLVDGGVIERILGSSP